MVKLIEKTPCAGLLPLTVGRFDLTEITYPTITSIAPFQGQEQVVSEALKTQLGVAFPAPNRCEIHDETHAVWAGLGMALVCGPRAPDVTGAAITDQSDGWAVARLSGQGAEDILARLVPIDLRETAFPLGHTARTMLAHLTVGIIRKPDGFEIMAMRSMAKTLVHDLETALRGVAARTA